MLQKTLQGQGVGHASNNCYKGQIEYKIQCNGPMLTSVLSSTFLTKITFRIFILGFKGNFGI